jgi:hypothetical protein
MKWYRLHFRDGKGGSFLDIDAADFKGFDAARLYRGELIDDWPSDVIFAASESERDERHDDVLVTFNLVPVYSARLQEALRIAGIDDFQFLPCRVVNGFDEEIEGYAVANTLRIRDAFAPEFAKVLYVDPNRVPVFERLNIEAVLKEALYAEKVADCDVFRLPQYRVLLFVSQRFKRAYTSIKATGISFREAVIAEEVLAAQGKCQTKSR